MEKKCKACDAYLKPPPPPHFIFGVDTFIDPKNISFISYYFISALVIDIAKFALLWKVMQGSLQLLNQWISALYTEIKL